MTTLGALSLDNAVCIKQRNRGLIFTYIRVLSNSFYDFLIELYLCFLTLVKFRRPLHIFVPYNLPKFTHFGIDFGVTWIETEVKLASFTYFRKRMTLGNNFDLRYPTGNVKNKEIFEKISRYPPTWAVFCHF